MICGDFNHEETKFIYRSSSFLTEFFLDIDREFFHDGSTRKYWVADKITEILSEPHSDDKTPPNAFLSLIARLMEQDDAQNEGPERPEALRMLNNTLKREGFEAFYGDDNVCYLRHIGKSRPIAFELNPHRPLTPQEKERRALLEKYLEKISEDDFIEKVLLPLFREMNFHRISFAGHKDKALEYGKDIWMKFKLPTQHYLYFGVQVKKGKLDAAGASKKGNANIAEIFNQITMMLGHVIFDSELNRRVLVDHAFIVSAGEITKQAKQWIGERLDQNRRSQIMFLDRKDILDLFIVTNSPLPDEAYPKEPEHELGDGLPF